MHFSKESLDLQGSPVFGQLVDQRRKGWSVSPTEQFIHSISQEHGILEECGAWMDSVRLGDELSFLPVHSCLTANLMKAYKTTEGQLITTLNLSPE